MKRENEILLTFRNLSESKQAMIMAEANKRLEKLNEAEDFRSKYNVRMALRERSLKERSNILEGARNDALSTIVKAIYIGALGPNTLTEEALILAESMVDKWIEENGGANRILTKVGNDSYLLSRITQIVEEVAEDEVKEIESEEDPADSEAPSEDEVTTDDSEESEAIAIAKKYIHSSDKDKIKSFIDQVKKMAEERKDIIDDEKEAEKAQEDADKASEKLEKDKEKAGVSDDDVEGGEEVPVDDEGTEDAGSESDENGNGEPDEAEVKEEETDAEGSEESEEDSTEDEDEEKDPDIDYSVKDDVDEGEDDDEDITIDGEEDSDDVNDKESKGKIFDELEKEDDVKKAVELIRNRVADAEEKFIKNNAEDKKKIDDLLNRISDNVKTVEDMNDKADKNKAEIAEEAVRMDKRRIDSIRNNRPLTVFESFTRKLSADIIKNESAKQLYLNESGSIDTGMVVESARVMYGFLETLNTLQFENVNADYIAHILNS